MANPKDLHAATIRDQFTRQAVPFARLPGHGDSVEHLLELSGAGPADSVLDVGCGPGLVACAFARVARRVTGLDVTPRMLEEARARQVALGLENLVWDLGSADPLPYEGGRFSIVLTRYTFHHLLDPRAALAEMCRVCAPGGRVLVADPVLPADRVEAFNAMERLRDPSHVRALAVGELDALMRASGLVDLQRATYPVAMELEAQLAASFPRPGDADRIRDLFAADLARDAMGLGVHRVGGALHFRYPISVYVGRRAG